MSGQIINFKFDMRINAVYHTLLTSRTALLNKWCHRSAGVAIKQLKADSSVVGQAPVIISFLEILNGHD